MSLVIEGAENGVKAKVNKHGQFETKAITNCDCKDNSENRKQSYEFATGAFIAPTTTAEHAIFYLKNTSKTKHLHIHSIRTCGSVIQQWILYKNDTGGTIISNANAGVEINHNFSSSNEADADVWTASAAGKTRTGGSWMSQHINDIGHSDIDYEGALILGPNDSITLTVKNVASATTLSCARIHAYFEDID